MEYMPELKKGLGLELGNGPVSTSLHAWLISQPPGLSVGTTRCLNTFLLVFHEDYEHGCTENFDALMKDPEGNRLKSHLPLFLPQPLDRGSDPASHRVLQKEGRPGPHHASPDEDPPVAGVPAGPEGRRPPHDRNAGRHPGQEEAVQGPDGELPVKPGLPSIRLHRRLPACQGLLDAALFLRYFWIPHDWTLHYSGL